MSTGSESDPVLILGEPEDPHIQSVCQELERLRAGFMVADAWSPWDPMTLSLDGEGALVENGSGAVRFSSVWSRLKPRLGGGNSEAEAFALRERRDFLMALTTLACPSSNWMNDPWNQERAGNKAIQLAVARDLGFRTPRTWISNDAARVAESAEALGGRVVYKPLTWLASRDGRVLFTNLVSSEDLRAHEDSIRCAPGIYQEPIAKRSEYRVTIVDDDVFPVRILSQKRSDTALDWRRNQEALDYESCDIPDDLSDRLLLLLQRLGLRYAAVDVIESTDGEFVFLEANPAGNWLWLEERLDLPIANAIASALCTTR